VAAGFWLNRKDDTVDGVAFLDAADKVGTEDPWPLDILARHNTYRRHHYDRAVALAETLIRVDPTNANGYLDKANAQVKANDPDRYKAIKVFLDRFGDDSAESAASAKLRQYLQDHPEPTPGT
jgi:hypothetical protein